MLTEKELQSLRNLGNEAEAAADEIQRLRECLQWLQERHRGGLMRAKIDEALGAKLRAEWTKPGGLMDGPFA